MAVSAPPYIVALATIPLVLGWALIRSLSPSRKLPYPPGPPEKGLISGNHSDLPTGTPWNTYIEWGKKYGNLLHVRAYDKHMVILNSYEDNVELLDKRSLLYSDRPEIPMARLMGWVDFDSAFMRYGPEWRSHRRVFQQIFKAEVSLKYRPTQIKKVQDFLYGLLITPNDFMDHNRTLSAAIIMSAMYAHDVAPKHDFFVDLADKAMTLMSGAVPPGASLLYVFPILRYLPTWFPGAEFKRYALEAKRLAFQMRDIPIGIVQKQMKEGMSPNCIAADLLETCKSAEDVVLMSGVAATGYAGGADTTASSMGTFFYAMSQFPQVQRQAQLEIDSIIGSDRLITFEDRPLLPYVEALYREVMRWRPVGPLSVYHATSAEDVYKGYYIPKGAIIISNIWAIAHDPERYKNPEVFNPGRFFKDDSTLDDDDVGYVFGFGRRICPGRHMASATVWLTIATVLQTFNVQKKRDANGIEIPISGEYRDGLIIQPLPFECSITPRSSEAVEVILDAVGKSL